MQLNVLLVEDDPDVREVAKIALTFASEFEVTTANDGYDALLLLKSFRPDVILLDCQMPLLSGFETCQVLNSDPELKSIPIIFLSAESLSTMREAEARFGAIGTITKPFDIDRLAPQVESIYTSFLRARSAGGASEGERGHDPHVRPEKGDQEKPASA